MERKSFLDQEAPIGYVAGLGRGATGFTTQQDIGESRLDGYEDEDDDRFRDASDDETGLLGDEDGGEADLVYMSIEEKLQRKRNKKRKREEEEQMDVASSINEIGQQFQDLKRDLATVDEDQWLNLPESGDFTKKNKRSKKLLQEQQRFYRAPDSVLGAGSSEETDLRKIQLAKDKLLELKLDTSSQIQESHVDSDKFLSDLSVVDYTPQELGDYQRMKLALANLRKVEPRNPNVWISSARLEEQFKKFKTAKNLISQGCEVCIHSEDAWLENVRLNLSDISLAKSIVAHGLKFNSTSYRLWYQACILESSDINKKRILQKALENIPDDSRLWFELIKYQDTPGQIKLLRKAIELVPDDLALWLKLISLSPYEDAVNVLQSATEQFGNVEEICIEKFRLCEIYNPEQLESLVRDTNIQSEWLEHLDESIPQTCKLLFAQSSNGTIVGLIEKYIEAEKYSIVRLLYQEISRRSEGYWDDYLEFEETHGTLSDQEECYAEMIKHRKESIVWLMYAKFKWRQNDLDTTAAILYDCLAQFQEESVYFAVEKFENYRQNYSKVEEVLKDSVAKLGTERTYYKLVNFLRCDNRGEEATMLVAEGATKYPGSWKLRLQQIQLTSVPDALYSKAVSEIPSAIAIWIAYARHMESRGVVIRARSVLEQAEIANPANETILLEQVMLEKRTGGAYSFKLAQNLKKLPKSGKLLSVQLETFETKSKRKQAYISFLKLTDESNAEIILAIAKSLWLRDANIAKAESFFRMALDKDDVNGDIYGWYYKFLNKHGDDPEQKQLLERYLAAEPYRGDAYNAFKKQIGNQRKPAEQILHDFVETLV